VEPANYEEKTANLYRFKYELPARGELKTLVKEESPRQETVALASLSLDSLLGYCTNSEIPAAARSALTKAAGLQRKVSAALKALDELQARQKRSVDEESRIRENLKAVGVSSPQGQSYAQRLSTLDASIDAFNADIDKAGQTLSAAQKELADYLDGLTL
jgi:hypothetical protein